MAAFTGSCFLLLNLKHNHLAILMISYIKSIFVT